MRKLLYVFICCMFFTCKEQKPEGAKTPQVVEDLKEWLVFEGADEKSKHIVLVSGDEEYRSEEALPQLAKILSRHHGFKCTVLFAQDPAKPGIVNANYVKNIPGLGALTTADMMIIFTRFRALPDNQMQHIDDYLKSGKPVMGIRTATHAFKFDKDSLSNFKHYGNYYSGDKTEWKDGFGRLVLGENWVSHHGHHKHQSTRGIIAENAKSSGISNGIIDGGVWGPTDVYEVRLPLTGDAQAVVYGQVMNRKGEFDETDIFFGMKPSDDDIATKNNEGKTVNEVNMPIAWTKSYQLANGKKGRVFTTTIGASSDMLIEGTRRLLVNGVFWAMNVPVPLKADVTIVGEFNPTKYEFREPEYWGRKQLKIAYFE